MRYISIITTLCALLTACTGSAEIVGSDVGQELPVNGDVGSETAMLEVFADIQKPEEVFIIDMVIADLSDLLPDFAPIEDAAPQCEAGEGCFLDPCLDNSDCLSGWCVEHLGEGVCTVACQEECPQGWSCQQVGIGPDVQYICVSKHANLCRPCNSGETCQSLGGAEDVCVSYGAQGAFCGGVCESAQDCPWGFMCKDTTTVDGIETTQCVAEAGVCPCTAKSISLALWTTCTSSNQYGECSGKRVCTEDGLWPCDAAVPVEEACNGLDDDCDDETDEPSLTEGEYENLCDDGNPCTDDGCLGEEGCHHELLDEGECIDGDSCTVGDHCEAGVCIGLPIACDDGNPCTDDMCDGLGGCAVEFNTAVCDDADPCTVNDTCSGGECIGFQVECECESTDECAVLEDGNLCNGTLVCDQTKLPYQCAIDLETVVSCPTPAEGPNAICLASFCDPESGQCSTVADHEGFACDDGDKCTVGDVCQAGECAPGVAVTCNDGNLCTDDLCQPQSGCLHENNVVDCSDGDVCTTADICDGGVCTGGPALECDDGNGCTDDACDPQVGCLHVANMEPCDDGNACTDGDQCEDGKCTFTSGVVCDDDNPCTKESCNPAVGCLTDILTGPCDDGNPCTTGEMCINGACSGGNLVLCDDNNPCTDDSCDDLGQCIHTANQADCADGDLCTLGDHCEDGVCVTTGVEDCSDDNPCTDESCDALLGCVTAMNSALCDDGDVCTLGDHCSLGECIFSGQLNCNDSNDCTDDSCDPDVGCEFVPNADPCDDGNQCTIGDACQGGACVIDGILDCDDDKICTKDYCVPASGCEYDPVEAPCDDGNQCTLVDHCFEGECVGAVEPQCDDLNPCTDDGCTPQDGCVNIPNAEPCTDDDACTDGDMCDAGACVPGPALDCEDDDVCTDDSCAADKGCVYTLNTDPCDDEDECTDGDACKDGNCEPGAQLSCVDGEACTTDACDPESGCVFTPFAPCCSNGILEVPEECDDGNLIGGDGCEQDCTVYKEVNVNFTNCSASGYQGPSQGNCDSAYSGQVGLAGKVTVASGVQHWTAPFTGTYRIEAWGAKGGCGGGNGARMRGDFSLEKGTELKIIVGQQGTPAPANVGNGGGGGSFVATGDDTPILVAGGGGGTGHNCENGGYGSIGGATGQNGSNGQYNGYGDGGTGGQGGEAGFTPSVPNAGGGGGFYGDGGSSGHAKGGKAFVNNGQGGSTTGGFGGGGGSDHFVYGCGASPHGGGGGGGYSGGGGGGNNCNGAGGGGGSFNNGANASNTAGVNSGHGKIHIQRL